MMIDKLTEQEWFNLVFIKLKENPNYLAVTVQAMEAGIQARLAEEVNKRATAEVALSMAFDKAKNKLDPLNLETCKKALKESHMFGGTEYVKNL